MRRDGMNILLNSSTPFGVVVSEIRSWPPIATEVILVVPLRGKAAKDNFYYEC
jgi:hypothetical protein